MLDVLTRRLFTVKWLGSSAPGSFALDGKLSKDDMVLAVRRWADAKGRAIVQPGECIQGVCGLHRADTTSSPQS